MFLVEMAVGQPRLQYRNHLFCGGHCHGNMSNTSPDTAVFPEVQECIEHKNLHICHVVLCWHVLEVLKITRTSSEVLQLNYNFLCKCLYFATHLLLLVATHSRKHPEVFCSCPFSCTLVRRDIQCCIERLLRAFDNFPGR